MSVANKHPLSYFRKPIFLLLLKQKGNFMKKIVLGSLLSLGLAQASLSKNIDSVKSEVIFSEPIMKISKELSEKETQSKLAISRLVKELLDNNLEVPYLQGETKGDNGEREFDGMPLIHEVGTTYSNKTCISRGVSGYCNTQKNSSCYWHGGHGGCS